MLLQAVRIDVFSKNTFRDGKTADIAIHCLHSFGVKRILCLRIYNMVNGYTVLLALQQNSGVEWTGISSQYKCSSQSFLSPCQRSQPRGSDAEILVK